MKLKDQYCKNCYYFKKFYIGHGRSNTADGLCRYGPPAPSQNERGIFPEVVYAGWCGRWTPNHIKDNPHVEQAWEEFKTFSGLVK